ncbi:Sec-independent protein translocase subunit TatA/TatB [Halorubellus salinus]|uniref:Sec-independent protein translocase subunit TatA/TatB n=1 Tax=Halorubellus salinus TaxID=755309 RepID=UPI003F6015CE
MIRMLQPLFIGGLGGPELVIIFMLVVLLFGANKLPKLARASGEAMGEFQKGRDEIEREIKDATSVESEDADEIDSTADPSLETDSTADPDLETDVDSDRTPSA